MPTGWPSPLQPSRSLLRVLLPLSEASHRHAMNPAPVFTENRRRRLSCIVALLTMLVALGGSAAGATAASSSMSLLEDTSEKGVFNMGPGQGNAKRAFDAARQKDVLEFDYAVPKGSVIGVWSKGFPPALSAKTVDALRIGINVPNPDQLQQVALKMEVKGDRATQNIPLQLTAGWNTIQEPINWGLIGTLQEVVLVLKPVLGPKSSGEPIAGALYLDIDFYQLPFWSKQLSWVKVGFVLVLSLCMALATALLGRCCGWPRAPGQSQSLSHGHAGADTSTRVRLTQDLLYGVVAVLMAGVALKIYAMGTMSAVDAGIDAGLLAAGLAGALIAELLKWRFTGRHLAPGEVFQDILLTGLLVAGSTRQELLQAPSTWTELLTISHLVAVVAFLLYHLINARSLAASGTHIRPITGALIVGTPYLFGWLLLLEHGHLAQALGQGLTGGLLAAWPAVPDILGRFLIVVGFNEAVMNGASLMISGRTLKTARAHQAIGLVSLAVVCAPLIADLGSGVAVASLPIAMQCLIAVVTTMLAHAGLWGEVYLITGLILDGIQRLAPSGNTITGHVRKGMGKGMAYSGLFMAILYALRLLLNAPGSQALLRHAPSLIGLVSGAAVFPFLKTLIETFDGSQPFFDRVRYNYGKGTLYARGAIAGVGFAFAVTRGFFQQGMSDRMAFGLLIGILASGGVSVLRDAAYALRRRGRIQSWRLYGIDVLLGGFIGGALGFYLDAAQVPVIIEKFTLYTSAGFSAADYVTYPLVSKWGRIDLGTYTGGVKLLFTEAVAGVINWSIAAWLFAINRVFMEAFFQKDKSPVKFFLSTAGVVELIKHMLYVLRWGLWMSPIIFTFLRMAPTPTWYNQDGAIRTLVATYHHLTMSPEAFNQWSLNVFVSILAVDAFRVLIWMDHMGLRVATLVNLSFIGLDKLDERIARFIGPAAAQRYIPEAVKRFCTWGPLLIPFYLPRGKDWDYAWNMAATMQRPTGAGGLVASLRVLPWPQLLLLIGGAILVCAGMSHGIRLFARRSRRRRIERYELSNRHYTVVLNENGEAYSQLVPNGYDVSRRSYDLLDPCGRVLYLVDRSAEPMSRARAWPIIGNFPRARFEASHMAREDGALTAANTTNGIRTTVEIRLVDQESAAELWTVTLENMTETSREIALVPYLEWVLARGLDDRFHTQYARLFSEMEYVSHAHAILAWQKSTKSVGFLAADVAPAGFLTSRMDFIGRARSIWRPRILETLHFAAARDTAAHPTFDPIGSLTVHASLDPRASRTLRFLIGSAENKAMALALIAQHLQPQASAPAPSDATRDAAQDAPRIGHGEIPPGTPQPYAEYIDQGKKLLVHTPYTPRPFDHAMSNAVGHSVMVTNRGLHTSCNGNSQQNRLTPDWPDTVTQEVPSEAIYLYDPERAEWYAPTYHPLNDGQARHEAEFGVDGTAVFRMTHGTVSTELTVFVPPEDPTGVYLLTVRNHEDRARRMRIAPYFQIVLGFQPEQAGPLNAHYDQALHALFFESSHNTFRSGWAFAAMSLPAEWVETKRGRFFGRDRGVDRPYLVEKGEADAAEVRDERPIAAFLGTVEIPAHGERTIVVILGQADTRKHAAELIRTYQRVDTARARLEQTKHWWLSLMGTLDVETSQPEFDRLQNWLKYQTLVERIWARRGFYQTSGAFGFRDQLQDTINLLWVDPSLARQQIVLHASQQFIEGDVFHWFFTLSDGRTAFACRSHASDNPLWLVWSVVEYLRATGDDSILDEMTSYVMSENPFRPLPKNKTGYGGLYHRSTRADSVYEHCLRSIHLVLEQRMGQHGLPLIGTGDWNDGLDEIGSEGKGESVWLGFFLYYILKDMVNIIERREGRSRKAHYAQKMLELKASLELTWRGDRYLRAIHDDGTEIGVKNSGVWEIDALCAGWAVISDINPKRGLTMFQTALRILEKENVVLLGWPALREDTTPYLGRSSKYPEGVRENGMYCHGVQWLIRAARILAERCEKEGHHAAAAEYRQTSYRLWRKITPISHVTPQECELYGGQPNKQPADLLTTFDQGRMIWNGYTGAAGWLFREALEGVIGASLIHNAVVLPKDLDQARGALTVKRVIRSVDKSPLRRRPVGVGVRPLVVRRDRTRMATENT